MWVRASAGRLERDPRRRMQAFCDLQESILQGRLHTAMPLQPPADARTESTHLSILSCSNPLRSWR